MAFTDSFFPYPRWWAVGTYRNEANMKEYRRRMKEVRQQMRIRESHTDIHPTVHPHTHTISVQ